MVACPFAARAGHRDARRLVGAERLSQGAGTMSDDAWPDEWHSLTWLPLIAGACIAIVDFGVHAAGWVWRKAAYQFDPDRQYP